MNYYLVLHTFLCLSYLILLHVYFRKSKKLDVKYLNDLSEINRDFIQEVMKANEKQIIHLLKDMDKIKRELNKLKNKTEEQS